MNKRTLLYLGSVLLIAGIGVTSFALTGSPLQADTFTEQGTKAINALLVFGGSLITGSLVIFGIFMSL